MNFKTPPLPRISRAVLVLAIVCLATMIAGVIFVAAHDDKRQTIEPVSTDTKARITERFGKLPLSFEVNRGQTAPAVKFLARGLGYQLFLTGNEAVLKIQKQHEGSVLRLRMLGANTAPRAEAQDELPGKVNYFKGNDPERWLSNIPTYTKVNFKDVYPGIDMVYYGNQGELEYDFAVAPGADPKLIKFAVEGADKIRLDNNGDLLLTIPGSDVRLHKPVLYQLAEGKRDEVKGEYVIKGNEIRFRVRAFDSSKPLIIDPVLSYSTFLGGTGNEESVAIAVDSQGSAYVTGSTQDSISFPTTPGSFKPSGFTSAFISKLDPTGSALVYSTYLAGDRSTTAASAIAVDAAGNAHITGFTSVTDFPVVNGLKASGNFFKTTNSAANWSNNNTGITGVNSDPRVVAVAPNAPGTVYVGTVIGPFRSTDGGATWTKTGTTGLSNPFAFALAVDPTNSTTVYGVFQGGLFRSTNGGDNWSLLNVPLTGAVSCIVFDPLNPSTIYLGVNPGVLRSTDNGATWTALNNFGTPTVPNVRVLAIDPTNPFTIYAGTFSNGLFKTTNGGTSWAQMISGMGGFNVPSVTAIAIDPSNTSTVYSGHGSDGFGGSINKTTNGGTSWTQLTNGVVSQQQITGLIVDRNNSSTVYASSTANGVLKTTNGGTSWTSSSAGLWNSNVVAMAADPSNSAILYAGTLGNSVNDAFVTKLNASGSALLFSTYIGGSSGESGKGIAVDSTGNIYIAGSTGSANYPVVNPVQSGPSATEQCGNAFVTKINPSVPSLVFSTYLSGSKCDTANGIAIDSSGNVYVAGETDSSDFLTANPFQGAKGDGFTRDAFVTKLTTTGSLVYSTYLGGNSTDTGMAIAADPAGNAYVTGQTNSFNFPTANAFQPTSGSFSGDVFVTKLNPQGSALVYSTYLGGSDTDTGRGIAADANGNAYVTGSTGSSDFPLANGAIRNKSLVYKSANAGGSWSNDNYGLKAASVTAIAVHPTQPATIYLGARNGMFKSTNGGKNWSTINNGLNNLGVTAVVINPAAPSTLYAATNDFFNLGTGVYKSTDGGNSWTLRTTGMGFTNVVSLAIDPVSPSTLYAGTDPGPIYKTVDGGDNWTPVDNSPSPVYSLSVDPHNHTIVFAAMHFSNGGILRSIDSGATWQFVAQHPPGQNFFVGVSPLTPGLVFASGTGLIRSTDNGNTWSQSHSDRGTVFYDPVNAATVYFVSFTQGLLKSTDAGQTWTAINTGLPTLSHRALGIDPVKTSTLYLATGEGFFDEDAFVTKINPTGSALIYSTLLGGGPVPGVTNDANDQGLGIAIDSAGNAYVTGAARAPAFPITDTAYQPFNRGFADAFITKLSNSYVISGHVLENGVTPSFGAEVVLNDGFSLTSVTTESDGSYEFSRLREGGTFTVSASKPHFTTAPPSQTFNNLNSDQVLDFSANTSDSPFYTISGQVTSNGTAVPGVTITLSGSQAGIRTTDSNGNYSFELIVGGNYTVTPSSLGFTFTPPSQTFNPLSGPQVANFDAIQQNFVVTNANDHGAGSLREAITVTNATPGVDNIIFNIPGPGVKVINLLTALPDITEAVVIDATTQPGYSGFPRVELDGSFSGQNTSGFRVTASGTTIRGFAIGRFNGAGISLVACNNNVIQANFIGINATGTATKQNGSGILLANSSNNLIGGTVAAARNVISGNSSNGIGVGGNNNTIQGNFIGTNPAGTAAMGNSLYGIEFLQFNNNNLVGGTAPGAGNLISGNQTGISAGNGNTIQGNLIGTDVTGTARIPNNTGMDARGQNNVVGGLTPAARNIISGNGAAGVIVGGVGTTFYGNYVGTDITGTLPLGNGSVGVLGGNDAVIGGTVPGARNVIAANAVTFGLANVAIGPNVSGTNVTVQGNYIGTDVTGTRSLGERRVGILMTTGGNRIGGTVAGAGNVISGNTIGIDVVGTTPANTVQGNLIGLNAQGTGPLPNTVRGIEINGSSNTIVGGIQAGAANTIAFNGGPGIMVVSGTGNAFRGNSIFSNVGLGIDLTVNTFPSNPNGVTPNDPNDADTGANNLQNFPVLTSVITGGGNTTIQGTLNSTPNTAFQIDFYSNAALDPSGNGEGALYFNTASVNTDNNGNATISVTFPMALESGRFITATATNPSGNTSEFSAGDGSGATGSLQFSVAMTKVIEDVGMANVTVVRSGGTNGNLSVEYATADGTATAGQDYTATSGTLNFNSGETSKTFQVPILDDAVTEADEDFAVVLRNGSTLEAIGAPGVQTVTIQDHNTVPFIVISDASPVIEGNTGTTTQATFDLTLSAATGRTVSVNFATANTNASGGVACGSQGTDYESKTGTVTFQPGATTAQIAVKICGDTSAESNEEFVVNLSSPSNASLLDAQGRVNINNDDVIVLILEESGPGVSQAVALSELFVRDPFSLTIPDFIFRNDRGNRVNFFATGVELNPGETPSAVVVRFIDSNNQLYDAPAEEVRSVPGFNFTQVMVKLPSNLAAGTCTVTVRAHFNISNMGTIRIVP